jgi:protein-L-isoaspartate(D-aspartate) O-methyltransferase
VISASEHLGIPGRIFDKILVSAAAQTLPHSLLGQLGNGGTLVIPVQHAIVVVRKSEVGEVFQSVFEGFSFVPLI